MFSTLKRLLLGEVFSRLDSHKDAIDQNAETTVFHVKALQETIRKQNDSYSKTLDLLENVIKRVKDLEDFNEKVDFLNKTKEDITNAVKHDLLRREKNRDILKRKPDYIA